MALRRFSLKPRMKYASAGEGKEQRCFHNGKEGENADSFQAANAERPSYARLARRRLQERKRPEIKQPPFAGGCFISGLSLTALVLPRKTVNKIGGVCRKAKNLQWVRKGKSVYIFLYRMHKHFIQNAEISEKKQKNLKKP